MLEDNRSLLIFSAPGPLGDRLSAFVTHLKPVNTVSYVQTVLGAITAISQHAPALIIVNLYPMEEETHDLLDFLKMSPSGSRCLILVESSGQAEQMGAGPMDEVLVWGFSPETLEAKIEQLITRQSRVSMTVQAGPARDTRVGG